MTTQRDLLAALIHDFIGMGDYDELADALLARGVRVLTPETYARAFGVAFYGYDLDHAPHDGDLSDAVDFLAALDGVMPK